MAQCLKCGKQTYSKDDMCNDCIDPCRSMSGNGPPDPCCVPRSICKYLDLDTLCWHFRTETGGGFSKPVCPQEECATPPLVAGQTTILRGCDNRGYMLPPAVSDSLVKNSQTHYTHTDVDGNVQDIYIPHLDFCFVANENCPSDGHFFSSECKDGISNITWEFSQDCQNWVAMGAGPSVDTTLTECGGNVRMTGEDPSGESWCITKDVPPSCCNSIEGEDQTDSLALFGGCFTVPPGFMCGYWFEDFAGITDPTTIPPSFHKAPVITLDNSDLNCPAVFRMQIETVGQQFAEVSQGGPQAEFFPLDNEVKMQVRINEAGDPWQARKFLSMYNLNDEPGSGQSGPTVNNSCRRFVAEQALCKVPSRNYHDGGGNDGESLQHDYRTQAALLQEVEVTLEPCEVAEFVVNPILYWNQADGGAGNNLYYERWHLSISAKVRREACK